MPINHLKIFLPAILLVIFGPGVMGQKTDRLDFRIENLPDEKIWLVFYYGDQQIRLDSALTDQSGDVTFELGRDADIGMYRVEEARKNGLDFIYNRESFTITCESDFKLESIRVSGSVENEVFFDYYRHKFDLADRIDILSGFLKYYPPSDTFYFTVAAHAETLSREYGKYLEGIMKQHPDRLVTRIIQFDQLPDIRPGELDNATRDLFKAHYFDRVDLSDSLILNTPLLPVKVIDYLSLYVQPGLTREAQETLFIEAVDSLMKFSESSMKVREMIVNYLINGFQAYGFENVLTHLVEDYVLGQSCVSDQQEEKLRIRIEGFKKLGVGSIAPDFEAIDSQGNTIRLSTHKAQRKLLIFWSGHCPHCEAILPELNNLYVQYKERIDFIGISVDQDDASWRKAIEVNKLQYTNIAELKGWEGKIIQDYYVYATPTFLLLDPSMRIIAKPGGLGELKSVLEK